MAYLIKDKNNEVIKRDDKEVTASDLVGVVKSVNLDKRTLRILATDETRDRDGDVISMKGWDFTNYIKNPTFLWSHDYSSVPLAASIKMERKRNPSRLVLTHKFPTAGVHPFADMILQLYNEKVINAGSVGFLPFDWEDIKDDDAKQRGWSNRKFTKQELLEHSGCAVPANPNAVQDNIARAMKAIDFEYDDKVKLYKAVTGEEKLELNDSAKVAVEEEIAELLEKGVEIEEETKVQVQVPDDLTIDDEISLIKYIVYENGNVEEAEEDGYVKVSSAELLTDNYKGLQEIFEEIFSELLADSLAAELDDYRKRVNTLLKVGAVLNRKNKSLLKQASENILSVLENAGDGSDAEANDSSTQASLEANGEEEVVDRFDAILNDETTEQNTQAKGEIQKVVPIKRKDPTQVKAVVDNLEKLVANLSKLM